MEFTVDRWMGYSRWGSDVEDRSLLSNVAESVHRPDLLVFVVWFEMAIHQFAGKNQSKVL
jgi:hypothetical protein